MKMNQDWDKRLDDFWIKNYGNPHLVAVQDFIATEIESARQQSRKEGYEEGRTFRRIN
jgi:hypothetical protein